MKHRASAYNCVDWQRLCRGLVNEDRQASSFKLWVVASRDASRRLFVLTFADSHCCGVHKMITHHDVLRLATAVRDFNGVLAAPRQVAGQ
jgi:hypothetical protein